MEIYLQKLHPWFVFFRAVCTIFNLLRSLKLGCGSETLGRWLKAIAVGKSKISNKNVFVGCTIFNLLRSLKLGCGSEKIK